MNYILLLISIVFETFKNGYANYFGKNLFVTMKDTLLFNIVSGIGASVFFLFSADVFSVSGYSFILAAVFSLISAAANYFSLMAYTTGPMSKGTLIVYMGCMIIPAVFGTVYYNQPVTFIKIIGAILMIISFVMTINSKKDKALSGKWFFYAFISFISWGLVGICQQIHQNSLYADEISEFLFWSFVMMTVFFLVLYILMGNKEKEENAYNIKSKASVWVLVSGVLIAVVYKINLYLAGKMPGIVFFPIVNGGVLLLSSLTALFIFKEKMTAVQKIGVLVGIISVCILGV